MASIDTTPVVVAVDFGPGGEALLHFDNRDTQYSEDVNEITDPPPKRRRKIIRDSDKQAKNNQEAKHLTDSFAALANVNISIVGVVSCVCNAIIVNMLAGKSENHISDNPGGFTRHEIHTTG